MMLMMVMVTMMVMMVKMMLMMVTMTLMMIRRRGSLRRLGRGASSFTARNFSDLTPAFTNVRMFKCTKVQMYKCTNVQQEQIKETFGRNFNLSFSPRIFIS